MILGFWALFLLTPPLQAAESLAQCQNYMVATQLQQKYCYKDKVGLERELDELKRLFANETTNLKQRIRELENQLADLEGKFNSTQKELEQTKASSSARILELEKTVKILKAKSGDREKELLQANLEMEKRFKAQTLALTAQMEEQNEAHLTKKQALEEELAAKMRELSNLQAELDQLKNLTKSQKAELERMKAQEQELAKQLKNEIINGEIRLKKFHGKLIINVDNRISFASGSAQLKKSAFKAFAKIGKILANYPENQIFVEGHTDNDKISKGRYTDNWQLSTERSLSVLRHLLKNTDLDPKRFTAAGYAEFQPVVPNNSQANKALNRRVDIVVSPRVK